jgi:hypothetical protein
MACSLRLLLNESYFRWKPFDVRWLLQVITPSTISKNKEDETDLYQCRWDRHPKTTVPRTHFHSPPVAGDAELSSVDPHHLDMLFTVLDWMSEQVE